MSKGFLSVAERHKLNSFPREITTDDLARYFVLSAVDLEQVQQQRGGHNRFGFALQLCVLRYLGFLPDDLARPPHPILRLLAHQLDLNPDVINHYAVRLQTGSDHQSLIMAHLGYRRASPTDLKRLEAWLVERALEHDRPKFLLHLAADRLRWDRIVRPGLTVLERLVGQARQQARKQTYRHIEHLLTDKRRSFLDDLLAVDVGSYRTTLAWLQQMPTDHNAKQLNTTLHKIRFLQQLGVPDWDVAAVNPNRLKYLANIGNRATNQQLLRSSELRRYPILVAFLKQSLYDLTDVVVDLFDANLWERRSKSKAELDEMRLKASRSINEKLREYMNLTRMVVDESIRPIDLRQTIFEHYQPGVLQQMVVDTASLIRPKNDEAIDFFGNRYSYVRQFAVHFLRTLTFHAQKPTSELLNAINLLQSLNKLNERQLPLDAPTSFITKPWHEYVFERNGKLSRRYYELAVLWELRLSLRSGDIYVAHARRYADPNTYLMPPAEWTKQKHEVVRLTQTPIDGKERIHEREQQLQQLAIRVEALHNRQGWLRSKKGHWVLTAHEDTGRPESAEILEDELARRLPQIDITDLVLEVDGWVQFSNCFSHASTHAVPTGSEELTYLYAAILAQGCNFSLAQMARSGRLHQHRLLHTNTWHMRDETLKAAIAMIVDHHHHLDISKLWGLGTFSSSDGQRFPMTGRNRKARSLVRYFGYRRGVTFYTWVSDQFSQYGSKAIASTMRDSTYVLDEILANETELPILEHTTDSHGYSEIVFALFDLLGLSFTPRIRDIADIQLYRTDGLDLNDLPTVRKRLSKRINLKLILDNWDEIMRLIGSLKLGWVTASLVIQKIQAAARKGQLARALQEYGRLVKTIHALSWYESLEKRRWTNRQLNKGEAVHALRAHLMIANRGTIQRKSDAGLRHQVGCLNLLTNAVILWNSVYMAEALKQLEKEGFNFNTEDVQHIWPTRYEHINVYGKYEFNLEEVQRTSLRELRNPHSLDP